MILNNKEKYYYNDDGRNKFSKIHYRDIHSLLDKYYNLITPFSNKTEIKPLLRKFTNKLKYIFLFLDKYIATKDKDESTNGMDNKLSSPFGEKSSKLLFENIFLETIYYLITLSFNPTISNFTQQSETPFQYDYTNDDEDDDIPTPVNIFQENMTEEMNIQKGNQTIVKECISDYVIQLITIFMRHKNMIDVTNLDIKTKVFKNTEYEKYTITDRLKDMSVEQRGVENIMKINKLGEWSVGLAKGIKIYEQSIYDKERKLFNDIETESDEDLINKLKTYNKGLDINEQDKLNEILTSQEISQEENDISDLGEDYHNYYRNEEDEDEYDYEEA
jgi:hypothetical protein